MTWMSSIGLKPPRSGNFVLTISTILSATASGSSTLKKVEVVALVVADRLPALVDAMGVADDMAAVVLAEDLVEARHRGDAAVDDIAQDIARAHRRQLVDIADQQQMRRGLQRLEQAVEEPQVEHGGFVDHQHVNGQGIALVVFEAPVRRVPEHAVDGAGVDAGGFGQAFSGAPGRRRQLEGMVAFQQGVDQHLDGGRLARARSAGQDADLAG